MTTSGPGGLVAIVTHARDVPSIERERLAVHLRPMSATGSSLLLETCHRVEAYAITRDGGEAPAVPLPDGGRILRDDAAIRHTMRVAVGADSVVVGEDQILHQFRETLATARDTGRLDPVLERLFTVALRAGRQARSWRQGPIRSLADVAIDTIERQAGSLRGRQLLVVGAGQMGTLAVRAGVEAGAVVSVASRTSERASELAARHGVRTLSFDPGSSAADVAGVIVALRGRWAMSDATRERLITGSAVIVDLSVPPAIEPSLAGALGARFVSADALASGQVSGHAPPDQRMSGRSERLVDAATAEFRSWLEAHERRAAAQALTAQADSAREIELAVLWRRLPQLDPEARDLIEGMSRHLAARLLREPLEHLSQDADGRHERAIRELFGL